MRLPLSLSFVAAVLSVVSAICPDPVLKSQSPIDIPQLYSTPNTGKVDVAFVNPADGILKNEGETLKVFWNGGKDNNFALNAKKYSPLQFHFHAPSEHRVRGFQYPFEMHIVHQAEDKGLAVLGVLFEISNEDNPFLDEVWSSIANLGDHGSNVTVAGISGVPLNISADQSSFYRYSGSLTTPPYTEGVEWTVVSQVQKMSKAQLDTYRAKIHEDSARETQPLNGRIVTLYAPSNP
ncbi:bifunctional monodehydroascorbate reductase and carbonic anhydrase nectarin-3-like [Achlya hypogyna]|uniref:Carbonic anhydrase n=1 Tax=Achlya hypogyna TaxID=1202772 RepID=A0A1V9Z2K7_ACHHY|nr:bifunctional monodehydroascorbate reductase and carbonic anhydrase nectarin-3-like [Achlya hypogyna]